MADGERAMTVTGDRPRRLPSRRGWFVVVGLAVVAIVAMTTLFVVGPGGRGERSWGYELTAETFDGPDGPEALSAAVQRTASVDTYAVSFHLDVHVGTPGGRAMDASTVVDRVDEGRWSEFRSRDIDYDLVADREHTYVRVLVAVEDDPLGLGSPIELGTWVRYPTEDYEQLATGVRLVTASDASFVLDLLAVADGSIEVVGSEPVGDVDTMRVRVGLDLGLAEEDDVAQTLSTVLALLAHAEIHEPAATIPIEVWVDAEGYVRRVTMSYHFGELGTSNPYLETVVMDMDVGFSDFGAPVEIHPPDPTALEEGSLAALTSG